MRRLGAESGREAASDGLPEITGFYAIRYNIKRKKKKLTKKMRGKVALHEREGSSTEPNMALRYTTLLIHVIIPNSRHHVTSHRAEGVKIYPSTI